MKSALSVRSVLWNFPQKCSCNCLWWSECFLKELKSWRSQKVAYNVYLIAIVGANFLLCIWRHILWLICFSVYRNSKHCLPSAHVKSLLRWCIGSLALRRKSGWGFEGSGFHVLLKPLAVSSLSFCQGFLILSSHSATHWHFSFQRACPTVVSGFVLPISVTCTRDEGFWL